ncbi:hypothetical protein BDW22DRAFT_1322837 [Trametopsis cervina]|nr:hypothetical protein BDW22DRAFT_1322837 [Trametopsis cervina]
MSTGYAAQAYPTPFASQQQTYTPSPSTPVQYPVQYPQTQSTYFSAPYPAGNVAIKSQSPPPETPSAPDVADVTPDVASRSIQKLISFELKGAGFAAAQSQTVDRLEKEMVTFVERIFRLAHDYGNLANRSNPIVTDLMLACEEIAYSTNELHRIEVASRKRRRDDMEVIPQLVQPPSRSPSPELLPSDDEGTSPLVPATLRSHPYYLPPLPPKHTYLRTPIAPPKKAALPSLEKKLKTSGLVQESLKHLLEATEDTPEDNGDGEILGAVVNWEVTSYRRKRWKV